MNRFRSFPLAAALAMLLTTGVVYGQGPAGPWGPRGHGPGGPRGAGLPVAQLNLTDEQQAQFRALSEQFRTQARPAEERLHAARIAQRNAIETLPVDEALIRSTTQELAEAQTELAVQQAHLRGELFALLTPAQQAQATKLLADREARVQQRVQQQHRHRNEN